MVDFRVTPFVHDLVVGVVDDAVGMVSLKFLNLGMRHVSGSSDPEPVQLRHNIGRYQTGHVRQIRQDAPYNILVNVLADRVAVVDEALYFHRVHHTGATMTKIDDAVEMPKIPFRGMEDAAKTLTEEICDTVRKNAAEYFVANTFASFLTVTYKNHGPEVRKKICDYIYDYIPKYFPDIVRNPYILGRKSGNIKELPLLQREAVRLFIRCYSQKKLESFSNISTALLRTSERIKGAR